MDRCIVERPGHVLAALFLAAAGMAVALVSFADDSSAQVSTLDCGAVRSAYLTALAQAQSCDVAGKNACGATRPRAPEDACQCQVSVNEASTAELDQLLAQFKSRSCRFDAPCNRACVSAARVCIASPGSSGTCAGN